MARVKARTRGFVEVPSFFVISSSSTGFLEKLTPTSMFGMSVEPCFDHKKLFCLLSILFLRRKGVPVGSHCDVGGGGGGGGGGGERIDRREKREPRVELR